MTEGLYLRLSGGSNEQLYSRAVDYLIEVSGLTWEELRSMPADQVFARVGDPEFELWFLACQHECSDEERRRVEGRGR